MCLLTRHLSLFGCLAAISVTPLGCGQTLQMTQSCCSTGQDSLHLSVSLSHTHTFSSFFCCVLLLCAHQRVCFCAPVQTSGSLQSKKNWGKKNDDVFCLQVPGLHASCVCVCVCAQMCVSARVCVSTHGAQFLFLTSALCWVEQNVWADFCLGCFTQA